MSTVGTFSRDFTAILAIFKNSYGNNNFCSYISYNDKYENITIIVFIIIMMFSGLCSWLSGSPTSGAGLYFRITTSKNGGMKYDP